MQLNIRISKKRARNERGQIAVLAAGAMVMIMAFAALAIDIGFFAETKRDAQNDADAMALAGVQELATRGLSEETRELNATAEAEAWAAKNDVDPSEVAPIEYGVTCDGDAVADTITVRLARPQTTFLARVLGINDATMNVCATARTGLARGGPGLLPIGLLYTEPGVPGDICYYDDGDGLGNVHDNFYYDPSDGADLTYAPGGDDEKCVVKITNPNHSEAWASGNTGPIRLDEESQVDIDNYRADCDPGTTNSGGAEYGENIEEGSDCPYGQGDDIRPLTGGQGGNTCSSFTTRHSQAHTGHNLTDVFMDPIMVNGKPVYTRVDETNPHFGIIPVITSQGSGSSQWVTIKKFVTVFVVGCEANGNGNQSQYVVTMIPVDSQYFASGQEIVEPGDADFTSDWPAYTIKLIE